MKGVTPYQLEIIQKLAAIEKKTGKLPDFDQLLAELSWTPSKESAQFPIRAVITKGLVKKAPLEFRRGRKRVCYQLTESGRLVLDPRGPAVAVPVEEVGFVVPGSSELMEVMEME